MLEKHEITDLEAAYNIILKAISTPDWRECNMLLQTACGTIENIAQCLQQRELAAETTWSE